MKTKIPTVSICIPTYNGEKYLEETLNSILLQTHKDFEVIVVDDQSTDNTVNIIKQFSRKDNRIHCYQNQQNLGLVGNWNKCVELAQGEWIKFVFQDDLIAPTCIEELLTASTPDTWLTICRRDFIFEEGISEETRRFYEQHPSSRQVFENIITYIPPDTVCQTAVESFGINTFGEPSTTLIRKEAFARHGLFNPNLGMICDTEYWVRLSIHHGFTYLNKSLASFRVHPDSTSANIFSKRSYRITLDGVILMYEYTHNSEFIPLREFLTKCAPPIDLNAMLLQKIDEARKVAFDAEHNACNHATDLLTEWKNFLNIHPEIKKIYKKARLLQLLKQYIIRHIS